MSRYIHERREWPCFDWDREKVLSLLASVRYKQGRLLGRLEGLGSRFREEATLTTLSQEVIQSSAIEGVKLPADQVRSSVARRLGIAIAGEVPANREVEGVVEMMLDATQYYDRPLTEERLWAWHASLFPVGRSGMRKVRVGAWRTGSMQVVSGSMGRLRVHFTAPEASRLADEMAAFLQWFHAPVTMDPVLKAAVAHFWFVTIHPFDDGNGRIARAISDMQLTRADGSPQRFYSMSAQIQRERNLYYGTLEKTQRGDLDITTWLLWFLGCLDRAITSSEESLSGVLQKAKFWEMHQTVSLNERQRKMVNKLMEDWEGKLTTLKWAKVTQCSQDTALRDIQDLIGKGILEKEPGGGRSTSYRLVLPALL